LSAAITALGTSFADVATAVTTVVLAVATAIIGVGLLTAGLRAIMRRFGVGKAKIASV